MRQVGNLGRLWTTRGSGLKQTRCRLIAKHEEHHDEDVEGKERERKREEEEEWCAERKVRILGGGPERVDGLLNREVSVVNRRAVSDRVGRLKPKCLGSGGDTTERRSLLF